MKPRLLDLFAGAGGAARGYQEAGFYVVGVDHVPQPNYVGDEFVLSDALEFLRLGGCNARDGRENGGAAGGSASVEGGAHRRVDGAGAVVAHFSEQGGGAASREGSVGRFDALSGFAGIHASPPCQAYSNLSRLDGHPDLIGPTRELLEATGLPYVIENVVGAPLHEPIMLCGSSFTDEKGHRLGVERHRLFECNFPIMALPCAHGAQEKRYDIYQRGKWYRGRVAHVWGTGGGKGREHWGEAMGIDWMTDDELAEAIPPAMTEFIGEALTAHLRVEAAA